MSRPNRDEFHPIYFDAVLIACALIGLLAAAESAAWEAIFRITFEEVAR